MNVVDLGKGGTWYLVAVYYPTARMARLAWERCEKKLDMSQGDHGIGVTRLAPNPAGGTPTGMPVKDGHPVIALTLDEATAQKAERILNDGVPWTPNDDLTLALIARRARVVTENGVDERVRMRIRRPDGRGATVDRAGNVIEPPPPRG